MTLGPLAYAKAKLGAEVERLVADAARPAPVERLVRPAASAGRLAWRFGLAALPLAPVEALIVWTHLGPLWSVLAGLGVPLLCALVAGLGRWRHEHRKDRLFPQVGELLGSQSSPVPARRPSRRIR